MTFKILKIRNLGTYHGPAADHRFVGSTRCRATLAEAVADSRAMMVGFSAGTIREVVPDLATDEPRCVRTIAEYRVQFEE